MAVGVDGEVAEELAVGRIKAAGRANNRSSKRNQLRRGENVDVVAGPRRLASCSRSERLSRTISDGRAQRECVRPWQRALRRDP